ncbi:tripartite tricarboxylate transporter TctB family protein [Achromobacter sp. Marseille-Q0513]|uniref:tripartite tricarboxylate transporter TctB family protein n=1 Tax=Achromobacter sp. Marseille-Q0513 TaxID=2829161 RepID=UPI001B98E0E0|nr:tripartite tricarboxylate transporter TctB family protein [Achromobacter sp. Marseille-Q0513]MBR8654989.1 tripartite tricarboxylate transporter TctB family protein [Achromobacter sp. Marseille-Q0513]
MQQQSRAVRREWWAGGAMIALGLGTAIHAASYNVGSLARMGPGMFPMILGVLLALLGAAIVRAGYAPQAADEEAEADATPDWRGWGCIIGGLLAFIALGKFGGLVPATLALVFISALGDRQHTVKSAALLSVGVTLLGLAVFSWGLQLQFPLFRWG